MEHQEHLGLRVTLASLETGGPLACLERTVLLDGLERRELLDLVVPLVLMGLRVSPEPRETEVLPVCPENKDDLEHLVSVARETEEPPV